MRITSIIIFFAMLLAGMAALAQEQAGDVRFSFVQITDTHWGEGANVARTQRVVEAINKLPMKITCVVHTGDITTNGADDAKAVGDGLKVMKGLTVPYHFVAGNHDILPGNRLQVTVDGFTQQIGPLASKAEYHGVVFLMLDTEPLPGAFTIKEYDPLAWLEQAIKEAGDKPVLIFHHGAAVEDFYVNTMHTYWPAAVKARWDKLVTAPNVKGIFAGHFHRDEMHWIGNTPVFIAPPVAGTWGRQAVYRIYDYDNGKISYRSQYVENM